MSKRTRKPHFLQLESRLNPAVTATLSGTLLNIAESAAGDSATVEINGSNLEVVDGSNNVILSTATAPVTDLSVTTNVQANQSLTLDSGLNFSGKITASGLSAIAIYQVQAAGGSLSAATITFSDFGSNGGQTITASDSSAQFLGVTYTLSNEQNIDLIGPIVGNDTFKVTPSTTAAFNVNGDSDGGSAELDVALVGTTGAVLKHSIQDIGDSGSWTFTNRKTIIFGEIGSFANDLTKYTATGVGIGSLASPTQVVVYNSAMTAVYSFNPYPASFKGGVVVATGDVTGDGVDDIVTGIASGADPHIEVFDGSTGKMIMSFDAFAPTYLGGVTIALGDVNGDGYDDIIVGAAKNSSNVVVFDGKTGALIRSFYAFAPGFIGGVNVAAGDLNVTGYDDIVVGAGPGADPHVEAFDGESNAPLKSFDAFPSTFTGGVTVAAADLTGSGDANIIAGAESLVDSHIETFDATTGAVVDSFDAFPGFIGGVRVAASDLTGNGEIEIIMGPGQGGPPDLRIITVLQIDSPKNNLFSEYADLYPFNPSGTSGMFVG